MLNLPKRPSSSGFGGGSVVLTANTKVGNNEWIIESSHVKGFLVKSFPLFFIFCGDKSSFCGPTGTLCFGLRLTLPVGFKLKLNLTGLVLPVSGHDC